MPPSSALFLSLLPPSNAPHPPTPPHRSNPHPLLLPTSPSASSSPSNPLRPSRVHCLLNENAQEKERIPHSPFLEKPWMQGESVKMPTAPWMTGPLLLPADAVLDFSKSRKKKADKDYKEDPPLTEKVRGGRNRQAMRRIVESIARLRETDPAAAVEEEEKVQERVEETMFSVPLEQVMKENEEQARGTMSGKMPWVKVERPMVFRRMKKERVVTAAELTLPVVVLARLRSNAKNLTKWVKAKKAGVTQAVVDEIRMAWRRSELAMVKFDVPLRRNMNRAREIVETKTGGLVVWRKNDTLVIYRGTDYQPTSEISSAHPDGQESSSSKLIFGKSEVNPATSSVQSYADIGVTVSIKDIEYYSRPTSMVLEVNEGAESISGTLYEREANRLLNGLGPRFIDWWWPKPLPVDADLLPETVPDFKPPFRLCPPRVRPKLTDDELTYLRKLARPLPTHFALGKNTKLQGLAAAIIKLWEKSIIAKIAVKRGFPNTNNEQMSCELKRLTGGVVILRNKFFIILYRGKDFLPGRVANSISERETELNDLQLQEEQVRLKAIESFQASGVTQFSTSTIGTFTEFQGIQEIYEPQRNGNSEVKVQIEAEKGMLEKELRKQEHRLLLLKMKIERSEKELAKLNSTASEQAADQELLTEEERQAFRKIGLKMDEFLLLGRRGVFDGVIRSIHLHWKHREIVKVITMQRTFSQITYTARLLEIESGGILVGVEKLRTGHAIIIYRGKNYRAPLKLLPSNLLTKREALQRSIEIQRRGSLKHFASQRQRKILELKRKLRDLEESSKEQTPREQQNQSCYSCQDNSSLNESDV